MNARATRQYWEGQYDALIQWATILEKCANQQPSDQLKKLASAARTKAVSIGQNKLQRNNNGKHAK
jgi:hypothetical protein